MEKLRSEVPPINILYFCQLYSPAIYGGGERIFFQWARELVKRGHRVFTITQRLQGTKNHEIIQGIDVYRVGSPIDYRGNLCVSITENITYIIEAVIKATFLLLRKHIDLIHSNTYTPTLVGYICSTIFRKPHIVTFHDVYLLGRSDFWLKWTKQTSVPGLTAILGPFFERVTLILSRNSLIHTVSETSKRDLISCNVKAPIVVIPNAVSLQEFDPLSISSSNLYQAVYIGRLVFYKNLETIINAFSEVHKKLPDARFVIVGDGPLRTHLQDIAQEFDGNITFTGRVSEEEKVRLLRESSFLVLPSFVEGFGIVILEAFACQKPVLVSNVMPLPEIVEDGTDGFIIPPFESDVWADKMLYLFTNPHRSQNMGLKGYQKFAEKYVIERIVDQLEKLYRFTIFRGSKKQK